GNRATERGTLLEPVIRKAAQKAYPGLEIETVPYMFEHPQYPFMRANIDGVILAKEPVEIGGETVTGLGGHEIKSAKTAYGWSETEIPDAYYCQVQHYMAVLGLPWFAVSVYILENEEVRHYVVPRNDGFIKRLIGAESEFWSSYIIPGIMPAAAGIDNEDDMITGMFDGADEPLMLTNEEIVLCREYTELAGQIKELETRKKAAGVDFKARLVARAAPDKKDKRLSASGGGFSVSWSFYQRHGVDSDALKKDGIFEQYCKISECDRMTITDKNKKKGSV
ncbi:MAG: YqaJ viral recombinase family protein, partial [Spirochaetaceae bacterium]|nr:YqaJ viral recombinase family protein [Spirochaetaceae bacterium]